MGREQAKEQARGGSGVPAVQALGGPAESAPAADDDGSPGPEGADLGTQLP